MDLRQQIARVKELQNFIDTQLPKFAELVLANDLTALIANRVVQRGETAKGGAFTAYSTTQVPAYLFWGNSRTQAAEKEVRDISRSGGLLSSAEFRELNNLRTVKKNFEFTGEMWRKFGIIFSGPTATGYRVTMGGTTTAAQDKIDKNSDEEGFSIIEASADEIKLVQEAALNWLSSNTERILNG